MSNIQISFKIIESRPNIPDINNYCYEILCYETNFKGIIYCSKNNKITNITNLTKSLKYIIKLKKKEKIFGVGNLLISQELFLKKIKKKKFNNINIFITENNYKKIFPKNDLTKINNFNTGINLSIEISIKYNVKEKDINLKKLKLMRRNFSFQERAKYKSDYSIKSTINNLTTSTTNIYTSNNLNNCNDNDCLTENNTNLLTSEKYIITTPSDILSPPNLISPLSDSELNNRKKKVIKKGLISSSISFKKEKRKNKNKLNNENIKYNIFDLKNKANQKSSRNNYNKFLSNKKKLNILITQESSSSNKNSNSVSQSSIIDPVLLEKDYENNLMYNNLNTNYNNDSIGNLPNFLFNKSAYTNDNDNTDSMDYNFKEIEAKINKILTNQNNMNKKLFYQEEIKNNLISTLNIYDNKIDINREFLNKLKEKNEYLKYKEKIILDINKELIPIISKVKESKEIESNILNIILSNYKSNDENKNKNNMEKNIEKYDKNLMIKMLKNVIQGNHNVDLYLNDDKKNKLKFVCDKYNIFGSIIEDVEE